MRTVIRDEYVRITGVVQDREIEVLGVVQDREIEVLPEMRLQWTPDCFHEVVPVTFEGEFDCYRFHFTQSRPLAELVAKRLKLEWIREDGAISVRGRSIRDKSIAKVVVINIIRRLFCVIPKDLFLT